MGSSGVCTKAARVDMAVGLLVMCADFVEVTVAESQDSA